MVTVTNVAKGNRSFYDKKGRVVNLKPGASADVELNDNTHRTLSERMSADFKIDGAGSTTRRRTTSPDNASAPPQDNRRERAQKVIRDSDSLGYDAILQEARDILGTDWSFKSPRPKKEQMLDALQKVR
jgi:hypothetical protein